MKGQMLRLEALRLLKIPPGYLIVLWEKLHFTRIQPEERIQQLDISHLILIFPVMEIHPLGIMHYMQTQQDKQILRMEVMPFNAIRLVIPTQPLDLVHSMIIKEITIPLSETMPFFQIILEAQILLPELTLFTVILPVRRILLQEEMHSIHALPGIIILPTD